MLQLDVQQRVFSISAATQGPILIISGVVMAPITARPASWPFQAARAVQQLTAGLQDGLRLRQQLLADARQVYPASGAFEQRHADFFFQRLDLCGDRRLAQMQQLCRLCQVALLRHGDKGPQLINFHDDLSPSRQ